ncbi:unnamed protein product [Echinostoma caproni]|uniref:PAS domain-containing protein n=1 Tax=Echinostoma caproni TaxID=27848 RepID=A0A183ATM5_9TREM|nr:unnamed protein product [Echinostoma caproni]
MVGFSPLDERSIWINRPTNMTIHISVLHNVPNSFACGIACGSSTTSKIAYCNQTFIGIKFGDNLLVGLDEIKPIGQLNDIVMNKLQFTVGRIAMKNKSIFPRYRASMNTDYVSRRHHADHSLINVFSYFLTDPQSEKTRNQIRISISVTMADPAVVQGKEIFELSDAMEEERCDGILKFTPSEL